MSCMTVAFFGRLSVEVTFFKRLLAEFEQCSEDTFRTVIYWGSRLPRGEARRLTPYIGSKRGDYTPYIGCEARENLVIGLRDDR
jgi:hypothetical protein